jgi:hypothetical protein
MITKIFNPVSYNNMNNIMQVRMRYYLEMNNFTLEYDKDNDEIWSQPQ